MSCKRYVFVATPLLLFSLALFLPVGAPDDSTVNADRVASTSKLRVDKQDASRPSTSPVRGRGANLRLVEAFGQLPLSFEPNQGQTEDQVRFLSRGQGYTLFLTPTDAVLALWQPAAPTARLTAGPEPRTGENKPVEAQRPAVLRMKLIGANSDAPVVGLEELPGKSNYFIGNDPAKWRTDVPNYARVEYRDLYPGVNLAYYGNQHQLEYDFEIAAGADPNVITLGFEGIEQLEIDGEGNLVLHSAAGDVIQHAPVIFQEIDGMRRPVSGRYALRGANRIGFNVAAYDASRPLVIDPVVLSYSSFLGGTWYDWPEAVTLDSSGNIYLAGSTASRDFPTSSALQASCTLGGSSGTSCEDVFIAKIDTSGSRLVFSTYLGGSMSEAANDIAIDPVGNLHVTGRTGSTDFPTRSPLQSAYGGGQLDAFVAKLNAVGNALVYSTYLGGSGSDSGRSIALDGSGNVYVTGETDSANFPTASAIQGAKARDNCENPPCRDVFVTKIDPTGSALVYSTYLGGSNHETGPDIAVDTAGAVYLTGSTLSCDIPTTAGAYRTVCDPFAGADVFVAKLNVTGSALVYSTYVAGSGGDVATGIAVDAAGNAYVAGQTFSPNFPTVNAFQPAKSTPFNESDTFVAKLNPTGTALLYSSFLGGPTQSGATATGVSCGATGIAADAAGNAYVVGTTKASDFPTVAGPRAASAGSARRYPYSTDWWELYPERSSEVFVAKINPSGSALAYSTFLGGGDSDVGRDIALDGLGNAYVVGLTHSADFPLVNPLQATYARLDPQQATVSKLSPVIPDNFASAASIQTHVPFSETVNASSATTEAADPTPTCGGGSREKSLWYRFVAPEDGTLTADTIGSSYDTVLSAWTGAPGTFTNVDCNDDARDTLQSRVSFGVSAGSTYLFMVSAKGEAGTATFDLNFQFPVPSHDNFVQATMVTAPFLETVNTWAATTEANDPTPSCSPASFFPRSKSVWYRFTAASTSLVTTRTIHSTYDTILSVWTGSPGNFQQVACNDDASEGTWQSIVSFTATADTTYYVMVTAFSNHAGKLVFNFDIPSLPANDNLANATEIPGTPFSHTVNLRLATGERTDPNSECGLAPAKTVWYRFTPASGGRLTAYTFGSFYWTQLSAWTGPPSALRYMECGPGSISFMVNAGTTYYFMVGVGGSGFLTTFNMFLGDVHENAVPSGSRLIAAAPATARQSTRMYGELALQPLPNCGNGSRGNSAWYRFTPTANSPITVDTIGSSYDTILSVWTGPATSLNQIACNDDAVGFHSRVTFPGIAGVDYLIMVSASNWDGGDLVLDLALRDAPNLAPANEEPTTATTVANAPFAQSVVTRGATTGSSDPTPACGNGSRAKSVWYRFTAPAAGTVVADTFGSNYNTLLSVWTGSPGSFTAVTCNDDASGSQSQVSFVAAGGITYYFMVSAANNDGGTLVFNLTFLQGVTSPIPTANVLTVVPHSAFGGGFLTRLYLANLVTSTNAVTVNRINQSGQLVGSSTATLSSLGTLLIANPESQRTQSLTVQWLAIGSERPLSASVLFDCCASGADVDSAVGMLGQASATAFTAPFLFQREVAGTQPLLEEGLAIANRANAANQVTVRLLDQSGAPLSSERLQPIPVFGQTAFTVSQLPGVSAQLAGKSTFLGSLEITATQPFAPVYVGNLGGRLFSLPIAASDQVPAGAVVTAIPHFVTGGGYVTRLLVRNLATASNTLVIQFLNQSGTGTGSETVNFATGQTIERTSGEANRSAPLSTQWITLNSAGAISASALFDCCAAGSSVTSAVGVLGQSAGTSFLAPFIFQRQTGSQPILVQGLGIANRSNATNTITIRVLDQNGTQISSDTLPALAAMGQTAFTVSDLTNLNLQLQGRDTFLGLLEITGTQPFAPVYVGNLGGRLFALPLTSQ